MSLFAGGSAHGSMPNGAHLIMQDRLSTLGSFFLCDSEPNQDGFLIRYVSEGFLDLTHSAVMDNIGFRCGNLYGSTRMLQCKGELDDLANAIGYDPQKLISHVKWLWEYAFSRFSLLDDGSQFVIVPIRTKDGSYLVVEVLLTRLTHPDLGFKFVVCYAQVSDAISIAQLLDAVPGGDVGNHADLVQQRKAMLVKHMTDIGFDSGESVLFFQNKMLDVWWMMLHETGTVKFDS